MANDDHYFYCSIHYYFAQFLSKVIEYPWEYVRDGRGDGMGRGGRGDEGMGLGWGMGREGMRVGFGVDFAGMDRLFSVWQLRLHEIIIFDTKTGTY